MTLDLRDDFSEFRAAAPARIHLAAHSHHFWPDAACDAHRRALAEAARLVDNKWEAIFSTLVPRVQRGIAGILALPDPATIAFASGKSPPGPALPNGANPSSLAFFAGVERLLTSLAQYAAKYDCRSLNPSCKAALVPADSPSR